MSVKNGKSKREALRLICDEIGINFSSSYITQWEKGDRAIPPKAVTAMQQHTASYAAEISGIKTSPEKAKKMASYLAPYRKVIMSKPMLD